MSRVELGATPLRLAAAVVGLSVLSVSVPAPAQDKALIQKQNEKFAEALNTGDAAAVGAMYTDDAVVLPPGAAMRKGKDEIQRFWAETAKQIAGLKLTAVDVKPLGNDAAREIGHFSFLTKAAQPAEVSGKYVVVWQKVGDDWRLATDIWNANEPPVATGSSTPPAASPRKAAAEPATSASPTK